MATGPYHKWLVIPPEEQPPNHYRLQAWCQSIHANGWNRETSIDELKDHLYCKIERLSGGGLPEEQALLTATERIGNVDKIRIEHAKNRSLSSTFSDFLLADSRIPSGALDMSKASSHAKKPLLPTITMAIGILLGGLIGAAGGSFSGNESVTIAYYVFGVLGGAVAGAILGWRIIRVTRRKRATRSDVA